MLRANRLAVTRLLRDAEPGIAPEAAQVREAMRVLHIGHKAAGIDQLDAWRLLQDRDLGELARHLAHRQQRLLLLRPGRIEQIVKLLDDRAQLLVRQGVEDRLALGSGEDSSVLSDQALDAQSSFDLDLQGGLSASQVFVMLDDLLEDAARLGVIVVNLVNAIDP